MCFPPKLLLVLLLQCFTTDEKCYQPPSKVFFPYPAVLIWNTWNAFVGTKDYISGKVHQESNFIQPQLPTCNLSLTQDLFSRLFWGFDRIFSHYMRKGCFIQYFEKNEVRRVIINRNRSHWFSFLKAKLVDLAAFSYYTGNPSAVGCSLCGTDLALPSLQGWSHKTASLSSYNSQGTKLIVTLCYMLY